MAKHAMAVCARHERAHRISEGCIYCVPVEATKPVETTLRMHTASWRDEWAKRASYSACMVRVLAQAVLGADAEYEEADGPFGLTSCKVGSDVPLVTKFCATWNTAERQDVRRHIVTVLLFEDEGRNP